MKRILILLALVVVVAIAIFYLKPSDTGLSASQSANESFDESSPQTQIKETHLPETSASQTSISVKASQPNVPLYDTKSDPSVQAIDPTQDPANEIKSK